LGITITCLVGSIAFFLKPNSPGSPEPFVFKVINGVSCGLIVGLLLSFVVWRIVSFFFVPGADRYKFRKRP